MRRTIAVTVVVGLMMMGLTAAIASADKGGVSHEGSNGKGRPAQGAPPAASEQQDAPEPARRTPPPRKKERANRHTQQKAEHHRRQPPAVAPAPATAPSQRHGQPKVTICHHTGSQSNPWVQITVAEPALKAHRKHGDLVPAPAGGCPKPAAPSEDQKAAAPAHEAPAKTKAHGHSKVTICHRTGSGSNPWVQITVAEPALKAHRRHGDLIPAPAGGCRTAEQQPDEPAGSPGGDAETAAPT